MTTRSTSNQAPASIDPVESSIRFVRGHRVLLDRDLAALYGVTTRALLQAIHRNRERFPRDFMVRLTKREIVLLGLSEPSGGTWGGRRHSVHAFTEQGVAMLSSVLRSRRAVLVNIEGMRAFVRLRRMLDAHRDLAGKLAELEGRYDEQFRVVFDALRELMEIHESPTGRIGFQAPGEGDSKSPDPPG